MKIAMVGQFYPHIGGVSSHIYKLSRELIKKGHNVYVITYPHKDIEDIDNIKVISTKGINIPGLRALTFSINAQKTLEELIKKEDIDIIHGHYLFPAGFASVKVGKKYNIPTYVTAHGTDVFDLYSKRKYMKPLLNNTLKNTNHIITVSNALKNELLKVNPDLNNEEIIVNWNSVDTDKFKPNNNYEFKKELVRKYNISYDSRIVLFVGNLIKSKNVKNLIKSKKHINGDCVFVIVGDGPIKSELEKYVDENNIKDVIFTGKRFDIENIIPSCDLLVLPSYTESFGLVLIEALSCGKPVIGSNIEAIKDIITPDVGLLIDPKCPIKIGESISRILNDDKLKKRFEKNARERAMEYSEMKIPYEEID